MFGAINNSAVFGAIHNSAGIYKCLKFVTEDILSWTKGAL